MSLPTMRDVSCRSRSYQNEDYEGTGRKLYDVCSSKDSVVTRGRSPRIGQLLASTGRSGVGPHQAFLEGSSSSEKAGGERFTDLVGEGGSTVTSQLQLGGLQLAGKPGAQRGSALGVARDRGDAFQSLWGCALAARGLARTEACLGFTYKDVCSTYTCFYNNLLHTKHSCREGDLIETKEDGDAHGRAWLRTQWPMESCQ